MLVKYIIYNPAGNITALVIGDEYSIKDRKIINDEIMRKNSEVEQVGFVSTQTPRLTMAGGEFCGNGLRCAVSYYNISSGVIEINNSNLEVGIDEDEKVWCQIPLDNANFIKIDSNLYKISIYGITIVVLKKDLDYEISASELKLKAQNIIDKYEIDDKAIGVMFCKENKIYPIVYVRDINTFFAENSCGSGTIAVSLLDAVLNNKSNNYKIMQPSGEILETYVDIGKNQNKKVILKGFIDTDNKIRKIKINK